MLDTGVIAENSIAALIGTIGGALVGGLIAGLFTLKAAAKAQRKKGFTLLYRGPFKLLTVERWLAKRVDLQVAGRPIENLLYSQIRLQNSGNLYLESVAFEICLLSKTTLIDIDAYGIDVSTLPDGHTVARKSSENTIKFDLDYLNPGEGIVVSCLLTGDDPRWKDNLRQPGLVVTRVTEERNARWLQINEIITEVVMSSAVLRIYMQLVSPSFRRYIRNRSENK